MKISANGLAIIKHFESLELKAYPDPGTGGAPWTIGYGHTGADVRPETVWTGKQADLALAADVAKFEKGVNAICNILLNQNQFDALVSFAYNVGLGNLQTSTLMKLVNTRDFEGAAAQFLRWTRAGGNVLKGLVRRRTAESLLFKGMEVKVAIQCGERSI